MKAPNQRSLRGVFFATLFLIVAVIVTFIVRNFTGKGPTPTRSAFAERLPGTQEGHFRRFQFFYATNRVNEDDTFKGQGSKLGNDI